VKLHDRMENKGYVVLVDEYGRDITMEDGVVSTMEKLKAHQHGSLHRAISVFIFNDGAELLLQQRAFDKYHSPGKWSNTCCTHPLPGELPLAAAKRRLYEEMGFITELTEAFTFLYKAEVGNGLTEHEFDHVFFGVSNQVPNPDPIEVSDWEWFSLENLMQDLIVNSERYSFWLRHCFVKVITHKKMIKSSIYSRCELSLRRI